MKHSHDLPTLFLFTALLLFGAVGTALAQDVIKVSSETHRVILENTQVRVMDVRVKPGEKVGMHSHPASVLYYLTDGRLKITYPDGRVEERTIKAGTAVWSDAVTHAAQNLGTSEFHEIHTELKPPHRRVGSAKTK